MEKKLKLNVKGVSDILSREEMKKVSGGMDIGSGSGIDCPDYRVPCYCNGRYLGCYYVGACYGACMNSGS